jgi:hypothetical protein
MSNTESKAKAALRLRQGGVIMRPTYLQGRSEQFQIEAQSIADGFPSMPCVLSMQWGSI